MTCFFLLIYLVIVAVVVFGPIFRYSFFSHGFGSFHHLFFFFFPFLMSFVLSDLSFIHFLSFSFVLFSYSFILLHFILFFLYRPSSMTYLSYFFFSVSHLFYSVTHLFYFISSILFSSFFFFLMSSFLPDLFSPAVFSLSSEFAAEGNLLARIFFSPCIPFNKQPPGMKVCTKLAAPLPKRGRKISEFIRVAIQFVEPRALLTCSPLTWARHFGDKLHTVLCLRGSSGRAARNAAVERNRETSECRDVPKSPTRSSVYLKVAKLH